MEHRPAAIAREAVTRGPDDVDVARSHGDAFLENAQAFVDERIQAALEDLLLAVPALRHVELARARAKDLDRLWIVDAIAAFVAVIALAILLAKTPRFVQREVGLVV